VTVGAFETFDLKGWHLSDGRHEVAFAAVHGDVLTDQRELGEIMVEELWEPVVGNMAALAIGHAVDRKILSMHIVVAVRTSGADVPEGPILTIFHMALETRRGLVSPL